MPCNSKTSKADSAQGASDVADRHIHFLFSVRNIKLETVEAGFEKKSNCFSSMKQKLLEFVSKNFSDFWVTFFRSVTLKVFQNITSAAYDVK